MVTIQNVNALLVKFEANVNNYATFRNTTAPEVAENIRSIRSWVDDQEANSSQASKNKLIADVGNVVGTSICALNNLRSGNPAEVMRGCLSIAETVAVLVGGPYGAAACAICSLLGSVLSMSTPTEPDLATVFMEKVHVELLKFKRELKSEKLKGLQDRVRTMNVQLQTLEFKGVSSDIELPDKVLFETDFPQFIGEVSHNIKKGIAFNGTDEDINDCLTSMVVYCNAQTSLMLLLTKVMATFKSIGGETIYIENLLRDRKQHATQTLGFLSDENSMSSALTPTESGKVLMIFHLRRSLSSYEIVDEFRQELGMTRMPELQTVEARAFQAAFSSPKGISDQYPQPQTKGDNHYFQLINHTSVPVKVVCGEAGDNVNGLKFCQDLKPYSSYEHVATKSTWFFSAGGFFIIYFDGNIRPFDNKFAGQNFKVFEFALSNPFLGFRKTAVLEKTDNLSSFVTGHDCWKQMKFNNSPPIFFVRGDKHYMVDGGYTRTHYFAGINEHPGKNSCRTWRFVVQEYDPRADLEIACNVM